MIQHRNTYERQKSYHIMKFATVLWFCILPNVLKYVEARDKIRYDSHSVSEHSDNMSKGTSPNSKPLMYNTILQYRQIYECISVICGLGITCILMYIGFRTYLDRARSRRNISDVNDVSMVTIQQSSTMNNQPGAPIAIS